MSSQLDPALPVQGSPISSSELRTQFQAISDAIGELQNNVSAFPDLLITKVDKSTTVDALGLTVSDPPTQAEVQAIADKLDAVILLLR